MCASKKVQAGVCNQSNKITATRQPRAKAAARKCPAAAEQGTHLQIAVEDDWRMRVQLQHALHAASLVRHVRTGRAGGWLLAELDATHEATAAG